MNEAHDDFAGEPVYGLPEELPEGESILWQGAPDRWEVATRIFHIRWIAGYFVVLALWDVASGLRDGIPPGTLGYGLFGLSLAAAASLGFVWWLAQSTAREAVYTITERRVVLRVGIALQLNLNLPYTQILDAAVKLRRNGTGDIALTLTPEQRLSWLALWPHSRPWHVGRVKPTLRCLPKVAEAAQVLGEALAAHTPATVDQPAAVLPESNAAVDTAERGLENENSLVEAYG